METSTPRTAPLSAPTGFLRHRRTPWLLYAGVVVLAVVATLAMGAGTALEHRRNPPSCTGIGWGCELDAGGVMFFFALLLAGPYAVVTGAVLALTELAGPRFALARSVLALAVLGLGAVATAAVLVELGGWL